MVWMNDDSNFLEEHVEVLPWLLPVFEKTPMYQEMMKEDIFALSKDADTFLKSVEGCEGEQYSPGTNSKLIVLLREQDINLQKIRLQLVQKDKLISVFFWLTYDSRMMFSGGIMFSVFCKLLRIISKQLKKKQKGRLLREFLKKWFKRVMLEFHLSWKSRKLLSRQLTFSSRKRRRLISWRI